MTRPTLYDALIHAAATRHGVDPWLVMALIAQESNWRPSARRAEPKIKDASYGLMQLLGGTATGLGYTGPIGDRTLLTGLYDPATNIDLGAKLVAHLWHQTGGAMSCTVSAYNGGYRPAMGFGVPAAKPLTICLARDQKTGACTVLHEVPVGSFSNQGYVDAVLAHYRAWAPSDRPSAA